MIHEDEHTYPVDGRTKIELILADAIYLPGLEEFWRSTSIGMNESSVHSACIHVKEVLGT